MPYQFQESDWKKYRDAVEGWRERYLARKNREMVSLFEDETKTATDRFWDAEEKIKEEAKTLVKCFDPHSRSNMSMALLMMLHHGVIEEPDVKVFSEELLGWLRATSRVLPS